MPYVITPADRDSFERCRRQWDFAARARQNLEPVRQPAGPGLGQAIHEALDIYYFPGMWDWQRPVTLPLVLQGFDRALAKQREQTGRQADDQAWRQRREDGRRMLRRYFEWAPPLDRFSPVLVEADYDVTVLDPASPQLGLVTARGEAIRYRGRIDMLAVDSNDAYWIVQHRFTEGDWPPTQTLVEDEEAIAACWAWEQFYLGMTITGTIYNEARTGAGPQIQQETAATEPGSRQPEARVAAGLRRWLPKARRTPPADDPRPAVRQHEPSGGGRSIPQHRRMYAAAKAPDQAEPIEQHTGSEFRRTWVRRDPAEVAQAWRRLAAQAAEMVSPGVAVNPNPSHALCAPCAFLAPCLAMRAGRTAMPAAVGSAVTLLQEGYRERPAENLVEGRLGGGAWGVGRGAAPARFRT